MFSRDSVTGREGLEKLRRVLRAYSATDAEVGYCQGMGFFTAMFLIYMPEEQVRPDRTRPHPIAPFVTFSPHSHSCSLLFIFTLTLTHAHILTLTHILTLILAQAFWQLMHVMQRAKSPIRGMFMPDMGETHLALSVMDKLVGHFMPKLYKHFEGQTAPHHTRSDQIRSRRIAPHHVASHHITSHRTTSHHIASHRIALYPLALSPSRPVALSPSRPLALSPSRPLAL